jgi:hypothetical protein
MLERAAHDDVRQLEDVPPLEAERTPKSRTEEVALKAFGC